MQEVRGEVLALDTAVGLLTLKQPGSTPFHSNLRVIRTEHVQVGMAACQHPARLSAPCTPWSRTPWSLKQNERH